MDDNRIQRKEAGKVPKQVYTSEVHVNNWIEDSLLKHDKVEVLKELHSTKRLEVDMMRTLYDNLNKYVELEAPKRFIRIGAIIQIIPVDLKPCERPANALPALTVTINERVVRFSEKINEDCELFIAPSEKSCVRNSFQIIGLVDDNRPEHERKDKLRYGEHFRLQCVETKGDEPLYVYAAQKSMDLTSMVKPTFVSTYMGEINLPVGLCARSHCGLGKKIPSGYCVWRCEHVDVTKRYETEGDVIPSNTPVVITHVATNRSLAAEPLVANTILGPEYMVSCQNYRDRFGKICPQNFWMLYNGQTSNN